MENKHLKRDLEEVLETLNYFLVCRRHRVSTIKDCVLLNDRIKDLEKMKNDLRIQIKALN